MNTLNQVIKSFIKMKSWYKPGDIEYDYYSIILEYLLIENKFKDAVKREGKLIYHYFMYLLPEHFTFKYLYDTQSPIRFSIETFDSIEEVRLYLDYKK